MAALELDVDDAPPAHPVAADAAPAVSTADADATSTKLPSATVEPERVGDLGDIALEKVADAESHEAEQTHEPAEATEQSATKDEQLAEPEEPAEPGVTESETETAEPADAVPQITQPEAVPQFAEPAELEKAESGIAVPDKAEPEDTVARIAEPEGSAPQVAEPEDSVPQVAEPEDLVPQIAEPDKAEPRTTEPDATEVDEVKPGNTETKTDVGEEPDTAEPKTVGEELETTEPKAVGDKVMSEDTELENTTKETEPAEAAETVVETANATIAPELKATDAETKDQIGDDDQDDSVDKALAPVTTGSTTLGDKNLLTPDDAEPPSATSATSVATSTSAASVASAVSDVSALSGEISFPDMAVLSTPARRLPTSLSPNTLDDDEDLNTIPDPRKRSVLNSPAGTGHSTSTAAEDEVTRLSTKLIDAINYQSTLDDTLSRTRMELEEARERARQLEDTIANQKEFLKGGIWVRKNTIEHERLQMAVRIREERRLRDEAEQARRKMEQELESLTAELFEQANKMVSAAKEQAREEQLAAAKRYDNLKAQLADTEGLLKSQQEQLVELKHVMEAMIVQKEEKEHQEQQELHEQELRDLKELRDRSSPATAMTTPISSGFPEFRAADRDSDSASSLAASEVVAADHKAEEAFSRAAVAETEANGNGIKTTTIHLHSAVAPGPSLEPPSPSYPTSFTHLLRPILRFDTAAYAEFIELIRSAQIQLMIQQQLYGTSQGRMRSPSSISQPKTPPASSGSWGLAGGSTPANGGSQSLAVASAKPGHGHTLSQGSQISQLSQDSHASLYSQFSQNSQNSFGSQLMTPLSAAGPSHPVQMHLVNSLKETKFYKRVLQEDIDPTLRLDTAPGIYWLARRNIMTAMLEGTLVAEPVAAIGTAGALALKTPCALCGESRAEAEHLRRHRFRLTESDKSTPYALCGYCLARVRSVCDFLGFLRMLRGGHWRADDAEAEQAAWEEGVRLREQMFWARIGGGVLPAAAASMLGGRQSRGASGQHNPNGSDSLSVRLSSDSNAVRRPSQSTLPQMPLASQSRSASLLTSSMAAIVSGLGGHVS